MSHGQLSVRRRGQNWMKLVAEEHGGPGEVPGRAAAVKAAKELSEKRRKRKESKQNKSRR